MPLFNSCSDGVKQRCREHLFKQKSWATEYVSNRRESLMPRNRNESDVFDSPYSCVSTLNFVFIIYLLNYNGLPRNFERKENSEVCLYIAAYLNRLMGWNFKGKYQADKKVGFFFTIVTQLSIMDWSVMDLKNNTKGAKYILQHSHLKNKARIRKVNF